MHHTSRRGQGMNVRGKSKKRSVVDLSITCIRRSRTLVCYIIPHKQDPTHAMLVPRVPQSLNALKRAKVVEFPP